MVDRNARLIFRVDTTSIGIKTTSCHDSASNWTSCINFTLHSGSARNCSILWNHPVLKVGDSPTIGAIDWTVTFLTFLNWWAISRSWISSHVVLARLLRNSSLVSKIIDLWWVTSFTWSSSLTVQDNLWRQSNLREGQILLNVDSISKCRQCSLSPTWSTILRNVLVDWPWHIISAINISPVPRFRKILNIQIFVRKRRGNQWLNVLVNNFAGTYILW